MDVCSSRLGMFYWDRGSDGVPDLEPDQLVRVHHTDADTYSNDTSNPCANQYVHSCRCGWSLGDTAVEAAVDSSS